MSFILAIDQGTTSSRAMVFDKSMMVVAQAQKEFTQYFPKPGWVEHDPKEIWESVLTTIHLALERAKTSINDMSAIGITNQRETVVVWDRISGKPIYNAIVWQDRRTAIYCQELVDAGHLDLIRKTTGLRIDPYFSATKFRWILDNVVGAQERSKNGELCFGTMDSFLIWKLTNGARHVTDATNASRTMLYHIHNDEYASELLQLFDISEVNLPKVLNCADDFGMTAMDVLGAEIPILGVAGDQQAAAIGQVCFTAGMVKSTYGTGCFALLNTGEQPVLSKNRMLTTIAYRLDGQISYALEGSIFIAGALVQWLRDELRIIEAADETDALARASDDAQNLIIVPAFTGLGAPYWNPNCRGAIFGISRNTGAEEFSKAALQAVGYQTRDLLEAMKNDWGGALHQLHVDGGMCASDFTMQFLADMTNILVVRPKNIETTALGVAWLAGMKAGIYPDQDAFAKTRAIEVEFTPAMDIEVRAQKYAAWQSAVEATLMFKQN